MNLFFSEPRSVRQDIIIKSIMISTYLDNDEPNESTLIEFSVMASNDLFNKMWFCENIYQNQKFLLKVIHYIPI